MTDYSEHFYVNPLAPNLEWCNHCKSPERVIVVTAPGLSERKIRKALDKMRKRHLKQYHPEVLK